MYALFHYLVKDVEFERVVRFPQVTCDVPGVVLYCFLSDLTIGPNGNNLDFKSFNFVMVRGSGDGGVDIKCDCCCDLSHIVAGYMVHACLSDSAPTGEFPIVSDLCKHACGLLELCGQQMQLPDTWAEDELMVRSTMLHAGQDVEFNNSDFLWVDDDESPDAPTCRELPYSGDTLVFEFLLSAETRNRRHRNQARFFPGSIVTRTSRGSYKCCSCRVHATQVNHGCSCVPTVQKFLAEHDMNVRKCITGIKVHDNGKSLALRGHSLRPIRPFTHPHVRSEAMQNGDAVHADWREARADRFMYAPSPPPPPLPFPRYPHFRARRL